MPSIKDINKQIAEHKTQIYFEQDGSNFYLYGSKHAAECGDSLETVTAPYRVKDSDMEAANKAREWFIADYCTKRGIIPCSVFEG